VTSPTQERADHGLGPQAALIAVRVGHVADSAMRSAGFTELLHQLGISLLVSTNAANKLLVDPRTRWRTNDGCLERRTGP
jgi:hypothetical protein